jgi:hypothetical protein
MLRNLAVAGWTTGEPFEEVSRFVDHSRLLVTTDVPAAPGGAGGPELGEGGGGAWPVWMIEES